MTRPQNLDLRTRDVELRLVRLMRCVKRKTLGAQEILSILQFRGQSEIKGSRAVRSPLQQAVARTCTRIQRIRQTVDPDPVSAAVVCCGRAWCFGKVDLLGARVTECVVDCEAEAVACGYCVRLRVEKGTGGGTGVAAHVCGVYVLEGGVGVVGFADVLVRGSDDFAVDDNSVIVPVSEGLGDSGDEKEEKGEKMHFGLARVFLVCGRWPISYRRVFLDDCIGRQASFNREECYAIASNWMIKNCGPMDIRTQSH